MPWFPTASSAPELTYAFPNQQGLQAFLNAASYQGLRRGELDSHTDLHYPSSWGDNRFPGYGATFKYRDANVRNNVAGALDALAVTLGGRRVAYQGQGRYGGFAGLDAVRVGRPGSPSAAATVQRLLPHALGASLKDRSDRDLLAAGRAAIGRHHFGEAARLLDTLRFRWARDPVAYAALARAIAFADDAAYESGYDQRRLLNGAYAALDAFAKRAGHVL